MATRAELLIADANKRAKERAGEVKTTGILDALRKSGLLFNEQTNGGAGIQWPANARPQSEMTKRIRAGIDESNAASRESSTLFGGLRNAGKVINEGLINPTPGNMASANAFKDSALGLLGGIPGADLPVGLTAGADYWNRGEKLAAAMSVAGGILPFVPATIGGLFAMNRVANKIGTPLPAGPGRSQAGMFIGPKAATWDAIKAQQANELLAKGIDPREVWKQTGTMRGADKALRQEIPDNRAILESMGDWSGRADMAYKHKKLYAAYPEMAGTSMRLDPEIDGGSLFEMGGKNHITAGSKRGNEAARSTAGHELQHAIQQREGWARGGSPDQFYLDPSFPKFAKAKELAESRGLDWDGISKADRRGITDEVLNNQYRALAGEAEARLTQTRMNMTMPERLASYPPDMFDVPMDQQIVRMGDNGPAMSYADEAARPRNAIGQTIQPTQYELAHEVAQRNAMMPVDQGGLGLPQGNTAMDRARAMGFETAYHGTASDVRQIDKTMFGSATGANSAKSAFWAASDPTTATGYADYAAKYAPVRKLIEDANTFERIAQKSSSPQAWWDKYDDALRHAEELEKSIYAQPLRGQNVMPLMINTSNAKFADAKGAEFVDMEGGVNQFLRDAQRSKNDVAVLENLADDVGRNARPTTHYGALNPAAIRSRFAAFDPAKRDSADLLAGVAPWAVPALGAGLLGAAMMPDEAMAYETAKPQTNKANGKPKKK